MSFDFNFDVPHTCKRPIEPPIENSSFLVWKKDQIHTAAVKAFIEYSKKTLGPLAVQAEVEADANP